MPPHSTSASASKAICTCHRFTAETPDCTIHFLRTGVVKLLDVAIANGDPCAWSNIVFREEAAAHAVETPAQRAERLKKTEMRDEKSADGIKDYEMSKLALINVDAKTGNLKFKTGRCCRDAEEPAKWVKGKKRLGNYQEWAAVDPKATKKPTTRPAGVPADAIFWSYGCEPHMKGCCPHLHPDEKGFVEAKATGGRVLGGAQVIMANAVYLSSKPVPKPLTSAAAAQQAVVLDAW